MSHMVAPTIWFMLRTFLEMADVSVALMTEEGGEVMIPGAGGEGRRDDAEGLALGRPLTGELAAA